MSKNQSIPDRDSSNRVENVRSFFDQPTYLRTRQLDIRIRVETIEIFVKGRDFKTILDIGCGDGSISMPLLNSDRHLTLLDLSNNMLSIARSRVPAELTSNVEFVNGNFMEAKFTPKSFDLIICVGVLAHVPAPAGVVAKIASLLRPGGTLILECTDAFHFIGLITVLRNSLAWAFKPPTYKMNLLSGTAVRHIAKNEGLNPTAVFRYALPFGWMHRFFSQDYSAYRAVRYMFGTASRNGNSWLGNQYIQRFEFARTTTGSERNRVGQESPDPSAVPQRNETACGNTRTPLPQAISTVEVLSSSLGELSPRSVQ